MDRANNQTLEGVRRRTHTWTHGPVPTAALRGASWKRRREWGKREEGGEGDEEGQERRKKEEQQSGMLSCFSITLPSIRWGTVPSHLTQLLCRH